MSCSSRSKSGRSRIEAIPVLTSLDDAGERKRVLNLLANRRYRQRRKELIQKYERQLGRTNLKGDTLSNAAQADDTIATCPHAIALNSDDVVSDHCPGNTTSSARRNSDARAASESLTHVPQSSTFDLSPCDEIVSEVFESRHPETGFLPQNDEDVLDLSPFVDTQSLGAATSSSWVTSGFPSVAFDTVQPASPVTDFSAELQSHETRDQTFPDEVNLPVWELILFRGFMDVSKRLSLDQLVFQLTALSPFPDMARRGSAFDDLPVHLRPTTAQRSITHHPALDLLPWPSVRSKLIALFALPSELRPRKAASSTGLSDFIGDMDDSSDGVKLWGDPFSTCSYEIGEKVYKRWWFAFDSDSIRETNERRRGRGEKPLGQGCILGEI